MSISDYAESAILNIVFRATAWANIADNAATTPETQIAIALATADPGDAGTLATSEITYGTYARVNVTRAAAGWGAPTGTPTAVSPAANITFSASTTAGGTASFFSAGKSTGSQILWSGTVTPAIACTSGVTPILTTATTLSLD